MAAIVFDRSFNGASFDDHDGPVRCCRAVPRSNDDFQSCRTRDKWWEGDGCVDRTERVQLQPHAKLVAIQTEACPAVRSTQPANALHVLLYTIHTVSRWKRRCNCLDCHEFSSTPLRFRADPYRPRREFGSVTANSTVMMARNPAFRQKAPVIRGGVWGEAPRFFLIFFFL